MAIATKLKSIHICSKCVKNHATFVRRAPNCCPLPLPLNRHAQQVKQLNMTYQTFEKLEKAETSAGGSLKFKWHNCLNWLNKQPINILFQNSNLLI